MTTATQLRGTERTLPKEEANRLEQRTLAFALALVFLIAFGSLAFGLYIQSDIVILNGIFSMFSLIGSGLNLTTAKLVARPADKRFQYGYWHVEPLVHCMNALMMCVICIYAGINGIEGLRHGGNVVDAGRVVMFSAVTGAVCGAMGSYELMMARRTDSQILVNDAREWFMDFGFSVVTLLGFIGLFVLPEPARSIWAVYADSALVVIMSMILLPFPIRVLITNFREVLRITDTEELLVSLVTAELEQVKKEIPVQSCSSHIVKVGRSYFVEVNLLVASDSALCSIAEHDRLRERLWKCCGKSLDELWLSVCVTADPRWL